MFLIVCLLISAIASAADKPLVVVIDAGHGGHDIGAPGTVINEKDVNLNVALLLGKDLKKAMGSDVKIIYTRDSDFFVKLGERADIANRAKADLFVSIHSNSIANKSRRSVVNGASVYVRGFASSSQASEVARIENAVLELEDNTKIDVSSEESVLSDLKWNKNLSESINLAIKLLDELVSTAGRRRGAVEQNDLAVLKRTKMPAVLVELEYICNPTMEQFMASADGQAKFAKALTNGIIAYARPSLAAKRKAEVPAPRKEQAKEPAKETVKTTAKEPVKEQVKEHPKKEKKVNKEEKPKAEAPQKAETNEGTRYKIQFLTAGRKLPKGSEKLKGLTDADFYIDGTTYKYTVGNFETQAEAEKQLKSVRNKFSDAFIITTRNGKRIK